MAMKISADTVRKQCNAWVAYYEANNDTGKKSVLFGVGEQWRSEDVDRRIINNKESLTFNLCKKHLLRAKSQSKQIEFGLNLSPKNKEDSDVEETNAFRMILHDVLLGNKNMKVYSDTLTKCMEYGYSFVEVNFDYEDENSLCAIPCLKYHNDPSIAFWDKNSMSPFKTDGRFCGIYKRLTKEEFISKYPKYRNNEGWLKDINNEVYDYWFRDYIEKKFYLLNTQIYKREDLLKDDDVLELDDDGNPQFKTSEVAVIKFMRTCNRRVINKPVIFPCGTKLPMPYHPGLTTWTPDGEMTFPFIHDLKGAQQLLNFTNSQLAVATKNTTADKWLLTDGHVRTPRAQQSAQNINMKEGAFVFDKDPDGVQIRREQPAEVPVSLINLASSTKQMIDEIAGAMVDAQNTNQMVLSGEAMDKIANNINMLQVNLFAIHIEWVNEVACILKAMIPQLLTEQRSIVIKNQDGSSEQITINQYDPTIKAIVKNNIKDIDDRFHYEITAGPSSEMQQENTLKAIQMVAPVAPQAFASVLDIYGRCLDTPYSEEISRRWATAIDPDLIAYSQGNISQEDFKKAQTEKSQQQMQQQMQMQQSSPQFQSMMQMAQAEMRKAAAQEFDSQTKRQKSMSDSMIAQNKLQLDFLKAMGEQDDKKRQFALQNVQQQMESAHQIMENMRSANEAYNENA